MIVGLIDDLFYKVFFIFVMVVSFNFWICVFREIMRCFFVGFIVIIKELLLFGMVFVIMVVVVIIYFMYLCFNIVRYKVLLFLEFYIVVIIEIMLFGYEWLVEILFKFMDCVFIGLVEKCFFFDGIVLCW